MSDLDYRIGKLELGPNDHLVVKYNGALSREVAAVLRQQLEQAIGERAKKMLVIDNSIDLSVLSESTSQ